MVAQYLGSSGPYVIDADGWLDTGDIGHIDDDGYLFIDGRIKDVIIRGGGNIVSANSIASTKSACLWGNPARAGEVQFSPLERYPLLSWIASTSVANVRYSSAHIQTELEFRLDMGSFGCGSAGLS